MPIMSLESSLGVRGEVHLDYDRPTQVWSGSTAHCPKTVQGPTLLRIQSRSTTAVATYFINPSSPPAVPASAKIPANDPEPDIYVHDWNGASLKISNISQENVMLEVTLISQGR